MRSEQGRQGNRYNPGHGKVDSGFELSQQHSEHELHEHEQCHEHFSGGRGEFVWDQRQPAEMK